MSSSGINLENFLIPLEEINKATENFNPEKKIGDGGFGVVYKGQLSARWQNREAAIKRLDPESCQGKPEFLNELKMVSAFKHENIISFIGYCDEGNEMIVVYEYARNGSLDKYLKDPNKLCCLTWVQRLKICLNAAQGLKYLHSHVWNNNRVIHRDIKSANILLDDNLKAKISDFGLSTLGPRNHPHTHVYTRVAGTQGYCDPIYLESGILSKESDVYSFGVVMFEMLTGMLVYKRRRIGDDQPQPMMNLVRRYYHEGLGKIVDPHITNQIGRVSLLKFEEIAYRCISYYLEERPTMDEIIWRIAEALKFHDNNDVPFMTLCNVTTELIPIRNTRYGSPLSSRTVFPQVTFTDAVSVAQRPHANTTSNDVDDNNGADVDSLLEEMAAKIHVKYII